MIIICGKADVIYVVNTTPNVSVLGEDSLFIAHKANLVGNYII